MENAAVATASGHFQEYSSGHPLPPSKTDGPFLCGRCHPEVAKQVAPTDREKDEWAPVGCCRCWGLAQNVGEDGGRGYSNVFLYRKYAHQIFHVRVAQLDARVPRVLLGPRVEAGLHLFRRRHYFVHRVVLRRCQRLRSGDRSGAAQTVWSLKCLPWRTEQEDTRPKNR